MPITEDDNPEDLKKVPEKADEKASVKADADQTDDGVEEIDDDEGGAYVTLTDDEDMRLSADEQGETLEEKRERRRQERKRRKENQSRRKEESARTATELAETKAQLRDVLNRFGAVDQHLSNQQLEQLRGRAAQLKYEADEATRIIAKAAAANDGEVLAQALEIRDSAKVELRDLQTRYGQFQANEQRRKQSQAPAVDAGTQRLAKAFLSEHSWIDPNGTDEDSKAALAIDAQLTQEGYLQNKPAYYQELKRRLENNLPHRFDGSDDDDEDLDDEPRKAKAEPPAKKLAKGGPPVAGGSNAASRPGAPKYKVSKERVAAMKEAGIWDDPVRRTKQVKAYIAYDRQNANAAR